MRWGLALGAGLAVAMGWVALWWQDVEGGRRETDRLLASRVAYWRALSEAELPNGTPATTALHWLHQRAGFSEQWPLDQGPTNVQIEIVKAVGATFICGDSWVIVSVTIGPDGRVSGRDASAMGICF